MTNQHPITPPPELVQQWDDEGTEMFRPEYQMHLAARAAQYGADQELEACCALMDRNFMAGPSELRAARRPKPLSLKEQALDDLHIAFDRGCLSERQADTIRRALEQLND